MPVADTSCPDNIDYNSLKHFIKANTTRDQAKAIAIPGQPDTHLAKVEDELYNELCAQHDSAGLFVSAKADEITRRLRTFISTRLHPLPRLHIIVDRGNLVYPPKQQPD